jgi:hypothetical protein
MAAAGTFLKVFLFFVAAFVFTDVVSGEPTNQCFFSWLG